MADHIKIGDVSPRIQYAGDGLQTAFAYPFPIFEDSDLKVFLDGAVLETGYAIAGAGDSAGGTVTFDSAPANDAIVVLLRDLVIARTTDFQEGGAFRADTVNDELDRQTAFIQQVAAQAGRAIAPSDADPSTDLMLPDRTARANKLLGFDADGALQTTVSIGGWRGDWTTATSYQPNDTVRSPDAEDIYVCAAAHLSDVFVTDVSAGRWQLAIDVSAVEAARAATLAAQGVAEAAQATALSAASGATAAETNAASSEALANEWAEQEEDVAVTGHPGEYSARHWAAKAAAAMPPGTVKASQAQAEAGTDNDTYVTPLRAAQHVDARSGTAIGDLVALASVGGVAGLPAVDGSLLTGLTQESFRATANGGSQFPPALVDTRIEFPVELWDLNGSYDNAAFRFTPKVGGLYLTIAHVRLNASPAADGGFAITMKKNGANHSGSGTVIVSSIVNSADLQHIGLVDLNGTTDYVEWYAFGTVPFEINGTGSNTNVSAIRIGDL